MTFPPAFKPVRTRHTIQDQIYDQLREALVCGAYEAGQDFTITALAEQFMTSHMPVREALRRLAAENALRISPTGTAVVPDLNIEELRQINETRLILEPAAAEIAFDHIDSAVIAELENILQAHISAGKAGDVKTLLAANRAFHFRIYTASGNAVMVSQIENLWLRSGAYVRYLSDRMGVLLRTTYKHGFASHHEDMLTALKAGDKAGIRKTTYEDINATFELLMQFLNDENKAPQS